VADARTADGIFVAVVVDFLLQNGEFGGNFLIGEGAAETGYG